jgi:hypothetical protein
MREDVVVVEDDGGGGDGDGDDAEKNNLSKKFETLNIKKTIFLFELYYRMRINKILQKKQIVYFPTKIHKFTVPIYTCFGLR